MTVQVAYPPLDTPKPVGEGLWIVDGGPISAFGLPLPVRMTVVLLAGGGLLLYSPTRFSPPLRDALERIGAIEHLLAPNLAHWMFVRDWQRAAPDAVTWAAPGLRNRAAIRRAGLRVDRVIGADVPVFWRSEIDLVLVPGAASFVEVALFHKQSRTLILTDLVQNLEPHKLPAAARLILRMLGGAGPDARPPVYLRALVRLGGGPSREAAERLIDFAPDRIVMTHGRVIECDGTARLKRSLGWLVGPS